MLYRIEDAVISEHPTAKLATDGEYFYIEVEEDTLCVIGAGRTPIEAWSHAYLGGF